MTDLTSKSEKEKKIDTWRKGARRATGVVNGESDDAMEIESGRRVTLDRGLTSLIDIYGSPWEYTCISSMSISFWHPLLCIAYILELIGLDSFFQFSEG
jgi:hypothetical protein